MANRSFSDPEGDVEITSPYRGNIICRNLLVTKTGSIVGNVEARDVRNHGRIHGVVNASEVFINAEDARVRGCVYAPHLGTHPKSKFEASASTSQRFDSEARMPFSPAVIEAAVQEGLRRELAKRGMLADDQGFSVSADDRFRRLPSERTPSLPSSFRTPDGKVWPYSGAETVSDFKWSAPAEAASPTGGDQAVLAPAAPPVRRAASPRALPPLFATAK